MVKNEFKYVTLFIVAAILICVPFALAERTNVKSDTGIISSRTEIVASGHKVTTVVVRVDTGNDNTATCIISEDKADTDSVKTLALAQWCSND